MGGGIALRGSHWVGRIARKVYPAACGVVLLIFLGGCIPQFQPLDAGAPILVLWHSFTGAEGAAIQNLSDHFTAENPWGIQLIAEYQRGIADKLAGAPPEQRPDLIVVWPEEVPDYMQAGLTASLESLPAEAGPVRSDLLPMAEALYTVDGQLTAFPLGLATYLLYTNADWLGDLGYEALPPTWAVLSQAACAAGSQSGGQRGLALPLQAGTLLAFEAAGGAPLVDAAGNYQLTDDASTQTLTALHELFSMGCGQTYEDSTAGVTQLGGSLLPLVVESSLLLPDMERAVTAGRNFVLRAGALPGLEGPGPLLWYGPGVMSIAPAGPRREAAMQALIWFLSPDAQLDWYGATHYLPVRRSLIEELQRQSASTTMPALLELTLESAARGRWVAWPHHTNAANCRAALVRALLELEKESALPELQQRMQAVCNGELAP